MEFVYQAVTSSGRMLSGVEDATSEPALEKMLRDRGLFPVEVRPGQMTGPRAPRMGRRRASVEAMRYLGTLVEAGFPVDRALDTTSRLVGNPDVVEALRGTRDAVRSGSALAAGLAVYSRSFAPLVTGMVAAGERGGRLVEALDRLADHMEREERLRAEVTSALVYPATMAVVGGTAIAVLMLYVLPRFVILLEDAGSALPASTALLMSIGDVLAHHWPSFLLGMGAVIAAAVSYRRSVHGRRTIDRVLARLPVIGPIRRNLSAVRFGRTLASLLASGLPAVRALEIASSSLSDAGAKEDVANARDEVETGVSLSVALGRARAFPYLFHQMVAVGEESGRLQEMLDRAAGVAEESLERALARMVRLVEPTLIVLFGIIAGFVALSLLQAIYGMRVEGF